MPNNFSDYAENAVLRWLLTTQAQTRPAVFYVGLASSVTGDTIGEIPSGSYDRQAVVFVDPTNGRTANTVEILWPAATINFGLVVGAGIWDAVSGGNLLMVGPLAAGVTIGIGDRARFASGTITVSAA